MAKEAYSVARVIDALKATRGMVYLAAMQLGCVPQTIYNYAQRHPTVKAAWEAESGKVLDVAELKLYEHVIKGEPWAIAFLLKTKGKSRGYTERLEQQTEIAGHLEVALDSARQRVRSRLESLAEQRRNGHCPHD